MATTIGNNIISNVMIGNTAINKIKVGSTSVYLRYLNFNYSITTKFYFDGILTSYMNQLSGLTNNIQNTTGTSYNSYTTCNNISNSSNVTKTMLYTGATNQTIYTQTNNLTDVLLNRNTYNYRLNNNIFHYSDSAGQNLELDLNYNQVITGITLYNLNQTGNYNYSVTTDLPFTLRYGSQAYNYFYAQAQIMNINENHANTYQIHCQIKSNAGGGTMNGIYDTLLTIGNVTVEVKTLRANTYTQIFTLTPQNYIQTLSSMSSGYVTIEFDLQFPTDFFGEIPTLGNIINCNLLSQFNDNYRRNYLFKLVTADNKTIYIDDSNAIAFYKDDTNNAVYSNFDQMFGDIGTKEISSSLKRLDISINYNTTEN